MIILHVAPLKFITLIFDEAIQEFRIYCMHNLKNDQYDFRLTLSGKYFARQGFLQSFYLNTQDVSDDVI